MGFIQLSTQTGIAEVTFSRGKVNALNELAVQELRSCFEELAKQSDVKAIILTGQGTKFFSFGFDVPEFLSYSTEAFAAYLEKFTAFYTYLFAYPKPVIAALNGHTIAGGCMLALACDHRVMVSGKAKISLNEIGFGSSLLAGSVRMLKFVVGERNAQAIAYTGAMYSAEEALEQGLVDEVSSNDKLMEQARQAAVRFSAKDAIAFRSIKQLLRSSATKEMKEHEQIFIREFVDI